MNEIVADALASTLSSLNFISKAAGCVTTLKVPIKGSDDFKRIPGTRIIHKDAVADVISCENPEDYFDVVPTDEEIGIIYFEDLGARAVRKTASGNLWKGSLQLVCWVNMKRIGTQNSLGTFQMAVKGAIPSLLGQSGYFLGGSIKVSQEPPKSSDPFKKYDYDEIRTQYLIYPYDYFTMKVEYTTVIAYGCAIPVNITPVQC